MFQEYFMENSFLPSHLLWFYSIFWILILFLEYSAGQTELLGKIILKNSLDTWSTS